MRALGLAVCVLVAIVSCADDNAPTKPVDAGESGPDADSCAPRKDCAVDADCPGGGKCDCTPAYGKGGCGAVVACLCNARPLLLGAACNPAAVDPCEVPLHCDCARRVCIPDKSERYAPCGSHGECGGGYLCLAPDNTLLNDMSCAGDRAIGACRTTEDPSSPDGGTRAP